jgi:predicted PurR-regulated permease PerM
MFGRKKTKTNEINKNALNELIVLSKNSIKILYILLIILGIYAAIRLTKEIKIIEFIITIIKIVAPLFIGFVIAWLFDPLVKWLQKKGVRRTIGTILTYIVLLGFIGLVMGGLIPLLSNQVNDFIKVIPNIIENMRVFLDETIGRLSVIDGVDIENVKKEILDKIIQIGANVTSDIPTLLVSVVKNTISGMGTIIVGLVIGFYLLMSFDNINETLTTLLPKKIQKNTNEIINEVNGSLRRFVIGAGLDALLIFMVSAISFGTIGLKAPLLFALFCALTNMIPFVGPYIGGIPAVIVGFSQSGPVGLLTLLSIVIIQFLEGNFIQPLVMSKTTKLHPVTIITGLLIFGHYWGIIGMFISTPIIASLKSIFTYLDQKYNLLKLYETEE